jgi:hypothetical protein
MSELGSLADVSKRVPNAVICLLSALQVHSMTTEAPHAVWVLIDRHARFPKVASPKLEVVRASGAARTHGVEVRTIEGVKVLLTTPVRRIGRPAARLDAASARCTRDPPATAAPRLFRLRGGHRHGEAVAWPRSRSSRQHRPPRFSQRNPR